LNKIIVLFKQKGGNMKGKIVIARDWVEEVLNELEKQELDIRALKALRSKGLGAYIGLADAESEIRKLFWRMVDDQ
jgi:hypothetical protein